MIGSFLYSLTPRDEQITPIQTLAFGRRVFASGANALDLYRPAAPFCAVIGALHVRARRDDNEPLSRVANVQLQIVTIASPPQLLGEIWTYSQDDEGGDFAVIQREFTFPLGLPIDPRHCQLLVAADWTLTPVQLHSLSYWMSGWLVPVGNLSPAEGRFGLVF